MKGGKTGKPKHQGKCIHIGPFQSTFSTFSSSPLSSFTGVIGAVWTYSTYHEVVCVLNPRRSQTTLSKLLEVEGQRGGTTLQLPPSLLSLSHSHLIPSFPLLFILQLQSCGSLSLCHKKFLPLFLYLSLRHKDGWRSSWNGVHNRLCHKVSSLSCIRLSAAFFSSCEAPYPTGVCVC